MRRRLSSSKDLVNSVSMKPGAIAFTVMPTLPTSRASERVKPTTAALDAAYTDKPLWPAEATIEEMLTILPAPSAIIWRATYLVRIMGDKYVQANQGLDIGIVHGRQQAVGTDPGIVDEAVDRAEFVAHRFCEDRDRICHRKVGGAEMQASLGFADGSRKLVALAARDGDHIIFAGRGEPARNGMADTAAAAGDDDVTHRCAPVFPLP